MQVSSCSILQAKSNQRKLSVQHLQAMLIQIGLTLVPYGNVHTVNSDLQRVESVLRYQYRTILQIPCFAQYPLDDTWTCNRHSDIHFLDFDIGSGMDSDSDFDTLADILFGQIVRSDNPVLPLPHKLDILSVPLESHYRNIHIFP